MGKLKTTPFDAADYLESSEDRATYASIALEEDGVEGLLNALGDIARSLSVEMVATKAGVSRQSLYRTLSDKGDPKLANFTNILDAMGLQLKLVPLTQKALDARETNHPRPDMLELPEPPKNTKAKAKRRTSKAKAKAKKRQTSKAKQPSKRKVTAGRKKSAAKRRAAS